MKIYIDEEIFSVPLVHFTALPREKIETLLMHSRRNWRTRTDACFVVKIDRVEELKALVQFEEVWRQPPPGTSLVTDGLVQEGDWFFATQLGAWAPVPPSGWGTAIVQSTASIARGMVNWNGVKLLSQGKAQPERPRA